ncbi:MAG: Lar family restriction alleviation protein [Oscillospiraceae bacterium]|nr:Lar family restriction alleviation protein [Oscillospiraceae bacterium]
MELDIQQEIDLQDCPLCGGPALLEEENNHWWYVMCLDCGAQTAPIEIRCAKDRRDAARRVANLWNVGKVIRPDNGE